jgi:hypothetical protein
MDPEVALVFRRLIASIVVLACLLGTVQPAIACANSTSRTDCCPAGSPADTGHQAAPCAQASGCCALSPAIASSVSAIGVRTSQDHGCVSSAAIALPITVRMGQYLRELQTSATQTPDHINDSLTYLRTARLRL